MILIQRNIIMPPNWKASLPTTTKSSVRGLKLAVIGQSQFAADVVTVLRQHGHTVNVVFTIEDQKGREDALAKYAKREGIPIHKIKQWRKAGVVLPNIFELYKMYQVDLNVLPYCSQFIPMEVINFPQYKTIIYHPSILPKHRGASSINWTIMSGDSKAGLTIFWADDGLDTGPILLQKSCNVLPDDTVDTLYKRYLYPVGVKSVAEAVDLIAQGSSQCTIQNETIATYEPMLKQPQPIDFSQTAQTVHDFIRGLDSVPGASCNIHLNVDDPIEPAILYGSTICDHLSYVMLQRMEEENPDCGDCRRVRIEGCQNAWLVDEGLMIQCGDNGIVNVKRIKLNGKIQIAANLLSDQEIKEELILSVEEDKLHLELKNIWAGILSLDNIEESMDFFLNGASSMDVVRLVEETKELFGIPLENEHLFLNPIYEDFLRTCIHIKRKCSDTMPMHGSSVEYAELFLEGNKRRIRCPSQLFIDGLFVDAKEKRSLEIVNPHNEQILGRVQCGSNIDVDIAVRAAKRAFDHGEWSKMSARDRGKLLLRLADVMEAHKEELAMIEALDSGAVYTLALKTHVGMSIETWRYYAGWCDKIEGTTIPISSARPNKNFSYTKREPVGVCGLITPWNYPLMMLSWKMAACLASGNTCIIKPAQVCPLTALKFAEMTVLAGIPPGVINIVPGTGSVVGNAMATHPEIRKLGFTGSTEIGRKIMTACAGNIKKISLELGGKSPLVIFGDSDLEKAVRVGMQSVFFNKGENCISAGRIFVESCIYDEFIDRILTETAKMRIGNPLDTTTDHGPQNHLAHLLKLEEFVRLGVSDGATLLMGGKRVSGKGYYFEPTVFVDVQDHMRIASEESFGPIMCISRFKNDDLEGVIKRANNTEYGLAAGVFTRDLNKAMRFSEGIKAGTVFLNTYNKTDVAAPFGGCKQSGFGKDLGAKALDEYLLTKTITMEY